MARYINHVTTQKSGEAGNGCNNNLVVGTSGSATALHPSGSQHLKIWNDKKTCNLLKIFRTKNTVSHLPQFRL